MKKVLFTLLIGVFMLIPISIKAELKCSYSPKNNIGDKYGEIVITKKDDGSFLVNDQAFNNSSIKLNIQYSGVPVYFAGSDASIAYNHFVEDAACGEFSSKTCPSKIELANITDNKPIVSFMSYSCKKGLFKCKANIKDTKANGSLVILKDVFTNNVCPDLNFIVDYEAGNYNKMYMMLLSDNEAKKQPEATKTSGIVKSNTGNTEIKIDTQYYYSSDKKRNIEYFKSVVYDKTTKMLKFDLADEFGGAHYEIEPLNGQSFTPKLGHSVKELNNTYDYAKFEINGDLQTKLDNWKESDYLVIAFQSTENATLNHYIVDSNNFKEFAKNVWLMGDEDAEVEASEVYRRMMEIRNARLNTFEVESIPFCAETSGALKVFKIVGYLIVVIKILVPLALIGFASVDFFRAMMSSNEDAIKKATTTVMQRAIIGVLVFFIPTLVYYFVGLIGNSIKKDDSYFKNCNTCLLNPDDCPARDPYVAEDTKK